MVVGRIGQSTGVLTFGVDGPKTAMVDGQNTSILLFVFRAISRIFCIPVLLIFNANSGCFSPAADNIAAKCITVPTFSSTMSLVSCVGSKTSRY